MNIVTRSAHRMVWQRTLALLVMGMGCANMVSSFVVRVEAREQIVRALFPLEVVHGIRHLAVITGLMLLALGRGLWRGKRWTWGVALVALLGSAVFHLLKGLDWEEAGAAVAIAGVLAWQRDAFPARADRPTLQRALFAIGWGSVVLVGYMVLGSVLLRTQFAGPPTASAIWSEIAARLWLGVGPLIPQTHRALWFLESISVLGVTLLTFFVGAILRPIIARPAAAHERAQAADLVRRYGTSSLAPFALSGDKSVFFGQHVDGVIAFRVANNVAVVCGDPLVAPAHLALLLHEWIAHCRTQGWDVCVYEASAAQIATYEALGLRTLKIGEDAWIDVAHFTLKGKPIADVRHAVSKIERDGLRFAVLNPSDAAANDHWVQMQRMAVEQDRGVWELQFSIGRLPAQPDPDARYTVVLAADGTKVLAGCAWLPIAGVNGWALDVMLRHADVPNGTMEYLIAQALLRFQHDGAAWASLGVAPLADAAMDTADEQSLLQRGVRFLYEHPRINELYRYKSLFFFKRKFVPQWRSVYLVYDGRLALPRILYAVLSVHVPALGTGFVTEFLRGQGERNLERWRDWLRRNNTADGAPTHSPRRDLPEKSH